jgi:hypothetical protein
MALDRYILAYRRLCYTDLHRSNVSGVLTSTIIKDTGIKQDQINCEQHDI